MNLQPQPSAQVTFHTSKGDIKIDLWAHEIPVACQEFIQVCLDGGFNGQKFNRVSKDFVVQTNGASNGGAGHNLALEKHPRLKFNSRGMVGLVVDETAKMSTARAFFITLDETLQLDKDHIVIGRVEGPTYYTVRAIQDGETIKGTETPVYPVTIKDVTVNEKYFDITSNTATTLTKKPERKKRKKAPIGLNYGDGDDEEVVQLKVKSIYDIEGNKEAQSEKTELEFKLKSERIGVEEIESEKAETSAKREVAIMENKECTEASPDLERSMVLQTEERRFEPEQHKHEELSNLGAKNANSPVSRSEEEEQRIPVMRDPTIDPPYDQYLDLDSEEDIDPQIIFKHKFKV